MADLSDQAKPVSVYSLRNRDIVNTFFDEEKRERGIVKHAILCKFLQAWLPMLGFTFSGQKEIIFVDGFAGTGFHKNSEEEGSPLVVYNAIVSHCHLNKINPRVRVIFVEVKKKYADELRSNLKKAEEKAFQEYPNIEGKVIYEVKQMRFDECMEELFAEDKLIKKNKRSPMFVFADPFGYSGKLVPFSTMSKLANRPRTDVFLNFMDSYMNRFVSIPDRENAFNLLYGSDKWKILIEKNRRQASDFALLYQSELLNIEKDLLFLKFKVLDKRNSHLYNLVFYTKHESGINAMKKCMAKESQSIFELKFSEFDDIESKNKLPMTGDADGGFQDTKDSKEKMMKHLISLICNKFRGSSVFGRDIERFILLETPYCFVQEMFTRNELKACLQSFTEDSTGKASADIYYSFPKELENSKLTGPEDQKPGSSKTVLQTSETQFKTPQKRKSSNENTPTKKVPLKFSPQTNKITNYFSPPKKCKNEETEHK